MSNEKHLNLGLQPCGRRDLSNYTLGTLDTLGTSCVYHSRLDTSTES